MRQVQSELFVNFYNVLSSKAFVGSSVLFSCGEHLSYL